MKAYLVVTITSPDHPGIVERITETVVRFMGNWEESRMARLGGEFAGIVKISVPEESVESLTTALQKLSDEDMSVVVKVTQPDGAGVSPGLTLCDLRLTGADHEGILHSVTAYLAQQGVNVESMETEVVPAPISGSPLFHMTAQIKVPVDVPPSELDENLQQVAEELGVDIQITAATEAGANP